MYKKRLSYIFVITLLVLYVQSMIKENITRGFAYCFLQNTWELAFCFKSVQAPSDLQLLRQWYSGNVYLLVLSKAER